MSPETAPPTSLILRTITRFLLPLLLLFSVFLLLRGHDEPGGGFIGGLVAVTAFTLQAIASGVAAARRALPAPPHRIVGIGLLVAAGSGALSFATGQPFMTGQWTTVPVPGLGEIAVGTPLLFDVGVYLAVLGVAAMILLTLAEE
jgi:multicomponent Na+:H+ antiporter subunit B